MAEYIEREKVQELIRGWHRRNPAKYRTDYMTGWNEALEQIECNVEENIPTADVRPERHGCWLPVESDVIFSCSNCENTVSTSWDYENSDDMFSFCPYCGAKMQEAKMDGKDGENDVHTMQQLRGKTGF